MSLRVVWWLVVAAMVAVAEETSSTVETTSWDDEYYEDEMFAAGETAEETVAGEDSAGIGSSVVYALSAVAGVALVSIIAVVVVLTVTDHRKRRQKPAPAPFVPPTPAAALPPHTDPNTPSADSLTVNETQASIVTEWRGDEASLHTATVRPPPKPLAPRTFLVSSLENRTVTGYQVLTRASETSSIDSSSSVPLTSYPTPASA